jgi:parallel beta-helix repeat protein
MLGAVVIGGSGVASALPSGVVRVGCGPSSYPTITAGVAAAAKGSTVLVCSGTYKEDVVVNKAITLLGNDATIDAAGFTTGPSDNGIQVESSDVTVKGFTVKNAWGEGILVGGDSPAVGPVSDVTLAANTVAHNDQGFSGVGGSTSTCFYGGDCGGGIHLVAVSHSTVIGNVVKDNADGILLTDEFGPTFDNTVSYNTVTDNLTECGIVLPSHNGSAVSYAFNPSLGMIAETGRNPSQGGVYDNKVLFNKVVGNGTVALPDGGGGSGSGIGLFTPFPGTGSYDNLVEGNWISGNGQSGVTLHSHAPAQDLNGNRIIYNAVGKNNLVGDPFDSQRGGPPYSDFETTGVAVYSAVSPVDVTVAHNGIFSNQIGVWIDSPPVSASGLGSNLFVNVADHIVNAG